MTFRRCSKTQVFRREQRASARGNRANRISAASAAGLFAPRSWSLFRPSQALALFDAVDVFRRRRCPSQNAGLSVLSRHERWCLSRSDAVLSCRSSLCRAWLRNPASRSPSRTFGGSGLLAAATASSNWIHILHIIAFYLVWSVHL